MAGGVWVGVGDEYVVGGLGRGAVFKVGEEREVEWVGAAWDGLYSAACEVEVSGFV